MGEDGSRRGSRSMPPWVVWGRPGVDRSIQCPPSLLSYPESDVNESVGIGWSKRKGLVGGVCRRHARLSVPAGGDRSRSLDLRQRTNGQQARRVHLG